MQIDIKAVLSFSAAFWLLCISCISVYACVLPWNNIAQPFLLEKYLCPGGCSDSTPANPANPTETAAEVRAPHTHTHTHTPHHHHHIPAHTLPPLPIPPLRQR